MSAHAANFFVATNGTPPGAGGTGAIGTPWDLQTAGDAVGIAGPGDTIFLREGVYRHAVQGTNGIGSTGAGWNFRIQAAGNSSAPLIFRSYPGEHAIVDGEDHLYPFSNARPTIQVGNSSSLTVGAYVWLMDLEICSMSTATRTSTSNGTNSSSFPPDIGRADGPYFHAPGGKIIDCQIHDVTAGISMFGTAAIGVEAYGNEIWNVGWNGLDRGHGHGLYVQGPLNTGGLLQVVNRNVVNGAYGESSQMYGSASAIIAHFRYFENILIGNRAAGHGRLVIGTLNGGAADRVTDNELYNNFGYGADFSILQGSSTNAYKDIRVANNYLVNSSFQAGSYKSATITNNAFYSPLVSVLVVIPVGEIIHTNWDFNRNTYVFGGTATPFVRSGVAFYTLAQWRTATTFDLNSTAVNTTVPSGTNLMVVYGNTYNTNRAHAVVYNWTAANFVALDVAGLNWPAGSSVTVRNAQDYFVDVVNTTVTSTNTIVADMRAIAHSVAIPYGDTTAVVPVTFPAFGTFILELNTAALPPSAEIVSTVNSSNPGSGVTITVAPLDLNGLADGVTSFSRTNATNVVTTLVAPSTASGNTFSKWQRNGVDYAVTATITFTNSGNVNLTAFYVTPTFVLTVASSNPASGADITISPASNNGSSSGTTGFTRTYNSGVVTSLTSPIALPSGNVFSKWQRNGVDYSTAAATTVTNSAATTMTAFYLTQVSVAGTRATSARRRIGR